MSIGDLSKAGILVPDCADVVVEVFKEVWPCAFEKNPTNKKAIAKDIFFIKGD
jgi:hypothetical protein